MICPNPYRRFADTPVAIPYSKVQIALSGGPGESAEFPTEVKEVLTLFVNSVLAMVAVVWEGPTGHDADSPVRRYNLHESPHGDALKILLTPALVAAATLLARRWVPAWAAPRGPPLTFTPVSIFLALEQGPSLRRPPRVGRCWAFCAGRSLSRLQLERTAGGVVDQHRRGGVGLPRHHADRGRFYPPPIAFALVSAPDADSRRHTRPCHSIRPRAPTRIGTSRCGRSSPRPSSSG